MTAQNPEAEILLQRYGLRPRHKLGQNFLDDSEYLRRIIEVSRLSKSVEVLEIGCGTGSLTRYLAASAASVIAVELDAALARIAGDVLADVMNVSIVTADFLKTTSADLGLAPGYVVVANIPYYVTSPILRKLLESEPRPSRIVLTIQEEVGRRICASPPNMSLLALSVQVYCSPAIAFGIPAQAFHPAPKVDSVVVTLDCYENPRVDAGEMPFFFKAARAGFRQPRKMLRNTLAAGLGIDVREAEEIILAAELDPSQRPETIAIEGWASMARALAAQKNYANRPPRPRRRKSR